MKKNIKDFNVYENLILILLFWIVLQDFVLSIFYNYSGSAFITKILFYSKDVVLIVLFLWSLVRGVSQQLMIGLFVFFVCVIFSGLVAIVETDIKITSLLQNIRNVIILPCFVCIGYSVQNRERFYQKFTCVFFNFIVICAGIGLVDYVLDSLIGTVRFWRDTVGVTNYLTDIKGQGERLVQGLPGNFYGQYGNEFFSVKRLVSIWMNPLTAAYLMALPFVFYSAKLIRDPQSRTYQLVIKLLILGSSIYFTHTRAIILIMVGLFVLYLILHPTKKNYICLSCLFVCGILVGIVFFDKFLAILYDGSTLGHISGIVGAISNLEFRLFGSGFGHIGISGSVSSESQYLTVLGNMGIVGLAAYLFFLIYPLIKIKKSHKKSSFFVAIIYMGLGYIITGLISEQLSAYTTIVPYYLILGVLMKQAEGERIKKIVAKNKAVVLTR